MSAAGIFLYPLGFILILLSAPLRIHHNGGSIFAEPFLSIPPSVLGVDHQRLANACGEGAGPAARRGLVALYGWESWPPCLQGGASLRLRSVPGVPLRLWRRRDRPEAQFLRRIFHRHRPSARSPLEGQKAYHPSQCLPNAF